MFTPSSGETDPVNKTNLNALHKYLEDNKITFQDYAIPATGYMFDSNEIKVVASIFAGGYGNGSSGRIAVEVWDPEEDGHNAKRDFKNFGYMDGNDYAIKANNERCVLYYTRIPLVTIATLC